MPAKIRSIDRYWEGWLTYDELSMLPDVEVRSRSVLSKRINAGQSIFDPAGAINPNRRESGFVLRDREICVKFLALPAPALRRKPSYGYQAW